MLFLALKIDLIIWYYFTHSRVKWQLSLTKLLPLFCMYMYESVTMSKLSIKPNENAKIKTRTLKKFCALSWDFQHDFIKIIQIAFAKRPPLSVVCPCMFKRQQTNVHESNRLWHIPIHTEKKAAPLAAAMEKRKRREKNVYAVN